MLSVQFCDRNHQAVAFLGTCPICRLVTRAGQIKPLVEGKLTYQGELDRALQAHYLDRLGLPPPAFVAAMTDPRRI